MSHLEKMAAFLGDLLQAIRAGRGESKGYCPFYIKQVMELQASPYAFERKVIRERFTSAIQKGLRREPSTNELAQLEELLIDALWLPGRSRYLGEVNRREVQEGRRQCYFAVHGQPYYLEYSSGAGGMCVLVRKQRLQGSRIAGD